jgi:hypothetical protein
MKLPKKLRKKIKLSSIPLVWIVRMAYQKACPLFYRRNDNVVIDDMYDELIQQKKLKEFRNKRRNCS